MDWNWYGVKTIYRTTASGKPRFTHPGFDHDSTGVEERIVLFRARSGEEAIRKAKQEARKYASLGYQNMYGQKVRIRPLRFCLAYEMDDEPTDGMEVFSSTEMVSKKVHDKAVLARSFGQNEQNWSRRSVRALKFIDGEIARNMLNHFSRND